MQIKCSFCGMPFSLTQEQIAEAIAMFKNDAHSHYDAHCPKCRRATKLARRVFEIHPLTKKMLEE